MPDDVIQTIMSVMGNNVRITSRQWAHVAENHDYMSGNLDKVLETIAEPDTLVAGDGGESLAMKAYEKTNITRKTAVVVYRDLPDGFMITAFFTSKPEKILRKGAIVWTKSQKN